MDPLETKAKLRANRIPVTVVASGRTFCHEIRSGLGFQALLARCPEVPLEFDCRRADCGICLISVSSGLDHLSPMTKSEEDFLKAMGARPEERLACQCRIEGPVNVEVPPA